MVWEEISIHTSREGIDAVSEICMRAGAEGTSVEDKCEIIEAQLLEPWELFDESMLQNYSDDVVIKCYLPRDDRLENKLAYIAAECEYVRQFGDYGKLHVEVKTVNEQDWANEWMKYFKPFLAGEKIVIKPTWEDYTPNPGELVIELDPGMAFGTGLHETTKMCIGLLEQYVQPGMNVIDIGCGSGILGIASSILGAREVLCIDNDPVCVNTCIANTKLNNLTNVTARENDLMSGVTPFTADIIIVNIIADVVISLIPCLTGFIKKGSLLITSGIIRDRVEDVLFAASENALKTVHIENMGEWSAICFLG